MILSLLTSNKCVYLLSNGLPISSSSLMENHTIKWTKDGILNVTLPTFEERIDYDVGETVSWTVLFDYTEYNHPLFKLQWHKNGNPIKNGGTIVSISEKRYEIVESDDNQTLTIRNVSKSDEGFFQLFINFSDGIQSTCMINFTLRVTGILKYDFSSNHFNEKYLFYQTNPLILSSIPAQLRMTNWASFAGFIHVHP